MSVIKAGDKGVPERSGMWLFRMLSNMHWGIGLIILLLLPTARSDAQSLDSLLAMIPNNNPELKALDLEYRAALQLSPQVSQLPDPQLRLGWFTLPIETRLGPQRLMWTLNQELPWPGKLAAMGDLANTRAAPVLQRLAVRQLTLEQSLKKSWLKLYRLERLREVLEEQLDIYQSLEDLAVAKIENNKATLVEANRIKLERNELQQRLTQIEIEKAGPQAEINRIIGRPANAGVTISGFLSIPDLPPNLEELLSRITTDHPMIRMLELQQEISRQALALNELDRKPDFMIGMDYVTVGKRTDADPMGNGRNVLMPHLAVSIPLRKEKYRAKEQEEILRIQALDQYQLDQLNTFRAMVEAALAVYRSAESDIRFINDQVYLLRSTLLAAQADYANGKRSFEELLQLQNMMIRYRERYLAALVSMHTAMADLDFYLLL